MSKNENEKKGKENNVTNVILIITFVAILVIIIVFAILNINANMKEESSSTEKEYQNYLQEQEEDGKSDNSTTKISMRPIYLTLKIGEEYNITYTLLDNSVSGTPVWSSSNENIALVDQTGKVKGISYGTTQINLTIGNESEHVSVTVKAPDYIEDTLTNMSNVYYNNEVNGNNTYFGKKVKVSAIVSSISSDSSVFFNTGVTIHLDENGSKYGLMCNNEDGIYGVNNINRGDRITVIGTMDERIGSSLFLKNCNISN